MKDKILYNGLSRWGMQRAIHMEMDTSSFTYKMSDDELVAAYKQIFKGDKHMLAAEDLEMVG